MVVRIDVIGVPYDSAGRGGGVARAPTALREAGLLRELAGIGIPVLDRGDIRGRWIGPVRDPTSGLIAPAALAEMIRAVRAEVSASREDAGFPVVIGGDCPILLGCLGAWPNDGRSGLLFIDGHEDAWPPKRSTTGEAADMELGFLLGRTVADLPDALRAQIPRLEPERVVVVGARDGAELDAAGVASIADLVEVVGPESIEAKGADAVIGEAVRRVGEGSWWLHVDLDVLSSQSLAAVDYPLPGGLDWETLTRLTERALRGPGIAGWDVAIYNPDLDPGAAGARRIVEYVRASLAVLGPAQRR